VTQLSHPECVTGAEVTRSHNATGLATGAPLATAHFATIVVITVQVLCPGSPSACFIAYSALKNGMQ
jgi:hypothetical protein